MNVDSLIKKTKILEEEHFFVYILKCSDGTYYTGITNNIVNRLDKHNLGKGAKYTRGRLPVVLMYVNKCQNKSEALKKEIKIKKMTKVNKNKLIDLYNLLNKQI